MSVDTVARQWPPEGLTRVPYWVYSDREIYEAEQARIFRGATWNFLCLEAELPRSNSYRRSNLGEMPVVVTRDKDGALHAFENRCAHRGSLLVLNEFGEASDIICVYHNWGYSQMLPSNWKLYMENVKDSYHASLLHTFFTTFQMNRLSQKGALVISDSGGNHVSYSVAADETGKDYAGMRAAQESFSLEAPEV